MRKPFWVFFEKLWECCWIMVVDGGVVAYTDVTGVASSLGWARLGNP